jgi:uncharacterized protein YwgA
MLITLNKKEDTLEFEYFDRYGKCSFNIFKDQYGDYSIELTDITCELCNEDDCKPYELTETELEGLYYWAWEKINAEGMFEEWQEIEDEWHNYGLNNERF